VRQTASGEALRLTVLGRLADRQASPTDVTHRGVVEAEIDAVLTDHERSVAAGVGTDGALNRNVRDRLVRSIVDYGPLTPFLQPTPIAEEVWIADGEISYVGGSRLVVHPETCHPDEMLHHVRRLMADAGFAVDAAHPQVRCMVLDGTARLTVTIPPPSPNGLDVHLRRYTLRSSTLRELVELGSVCVPAAQLSALNMRAQARGLILWSAVGG
jgi:Flp pilus assembly CpaF family ATPase